MLGLSLRETAEQVLRGALSIKLDPQLALIREATLELLGRVPDTWAEFESDALTAVQQKALFLLTAAGMVERRFTIRMTMHNHPTAVEAVITATGEYGFAEAMEPLLAAMWEEWREPYLRWKSSETADAPSGTSDRVKPELWRLTDQGLVAKKDIGAGSSDSVVDFVLWQGVHDGMPRLIGRRIKRRQPVRGEGTLTNMRKYNAANPPSGQIIIGNWDEGARVFSEAFQQIATREPHDLKRSALREEFTSSSTLESKPASATEEWSAPMSKAEMARRITGEFNARPRKIDALLKRWEIQHVHGKLWRIRLDLMDAASRKKIEKSS